MGPSLIGDGNTGIGADDSTDVVASMGPSLIGDGNAPLGRAGRSVSRASIGPSLIGDGNLVDNTHTWTTDQWLQWGRP